MEAFRELESMLVKQLDIHKQFAKSAPPQDQQRLSENKAMVQNRLDAIKTGRYTRGAGVCNLKLAGISLP